MTVIVPYEISGIWVVLINLYRKKQISSVEERNNNKHDRAVLIIISPSIHHLMYVMIHDGIICRNAKTISTLLNGSIFQINETIMITSGSFFKYEYHL